MKLKNGGRNRGMNKSLKLGGIFSFLLSLSSLWQREIERVKEGENGKEEREREAGRIKAKLS